MEITIEIMQDVENKVNSCLIGLSLYQAKSILNKVLNEIDTKSIVSEALLSESKHGDT